MGRTNGSAADRNGSDANGTVEPFAIPDERTHGATDGSGFPVESGEPERTENGSNSSGTGRKRGPKTGWKRNAANGNDTKKADRQRLPTVDVAAGVLQGFSVLSNATIKNFILKDPRFSEMELDDSEAEKIAAALLELAKFYPGVDVPALMLAWMNLAQAVSTVAISHVAIYKLRKTNEANAAKMRPAAVHQMVNGAAQ